MKRYVTTRFESAINRHYRKIGVHAAPDMCIESIASSFGIELEYYDGPCVADWDDSPGGHRLIALDKRLPEPERRAAFFHELTHPLFHCGRQEELPEPFVELQEIQATRFQLAAALPAYMLVEYERTSPADLAKTIAGEFCLPFALVMRRLSQIHNRILHTEQLKSTRRLQIN